MRVIPAGMQLRLQPSDSAGAEREKIWGFLFSGSVSAKFPVPGAARELQAGTEPPNPAGLVIPAGMEPHPAAPSSSIRASPAGIWVVFFF